MRREIKRVIVVVCGVLGLGACSPALNWRLATHEGVPLQALMPCKPERAEREVALIGPQAAALTLKLMACDAAGLTFAVGVVRVPEGIEPERVLANWRLAAWSGLKQTLPPSDPPAAAPPGWTALPVAIKGANQSQHWRGPGRDHLGQALQADLAWAVRGPWIAQVAVYGQGAAPEAREAFLAGLELK